MAKEEHRVKIDKPLHIYLMARAAGMMDAAEALEKMPENLRAAPGFALALATLNAEANNARGEIVAKNMIAIAKAGIDVARYESVMFDPNTAELICTLNDPDLFD